MVTSLDNSIRVISILEMIKMVNLDIFLFGKPEWEIDTGKAEPDEFRGLGDRHKKWLYRVAEIIELLEKNNWTRCGGLYDIMFYKDISLEEARTEISDLGIDENEIRLDDWKEQDFLEEDLNDQPAA